MKKLIQNQTNFERILFNKEAFDRELSTEKEKIVARVDYVLSALGSFSSENSMNASCILSTQQLINITVELRNNLGRLRELAFASERSNKRAFKNEQMLSILTNIRNEQRELPL